MSADPAHYAHTTRKELTRSLMSLLPLSTAETLKREVDLLFDRSYQAGLVDGFCEASLRDKLTDRGWVECGKCGGNGYIVEERTRTVAEHHPNCDGITCESTCPIPVPVPEYEREHCPTNCVSGFVPSEWMVEAAAQAISDAHFGTIPGDIALTLARAALLAAARWEREQ